MIAEPPPKGRSLSRAYLSCQPFQRYHSPSLNFIDRMSTHVLLPKTCASAGSSIEIGEKICNVTEMAVLERGSGDLRYTTGKPVAILS